MRYDLHTHTIRYSPGCGRGLPEAMCARALEAGLDGIAVTDHETWWPPVELAQLRERFGSLAIFSAVEYSCEDNDFIVVLRNPSDAGGIGREHAAELIRSVHLIGGIAIWAHPFRFSEAVPPWLRAASPDGMEVASSNMTEAVRARAEAFALARGIMPFRNSDAHAVETLGLCWNEFDARIRNEAELVRYVRAASRAYRTAHPPAGDAGRGT